MDYFNRENAIMDSEESLKLKCLNYTFVYYKYTAFHFTRC